MRLASLVLALPASSVIAQVVPTAAASDPKDVASPQAIVAALYDVLSGTKTQQRNWDRFRSLFIEGGRLIPTSVDAKGVKHLRALTADVAPRLRVVQPRAKCTSAKIPNHKNAR